MSGLNFGSIFGDIKLDTSKWTKGLNEAFRDGDRMVARARTTYAKGGTKAGEGFADGVERETRDLASVMVDALDGIDTKFARSGDRAGGKFADGVESETDGLAKSVAGALSGLDAKFAKSGKQSGGEFAAGVRRAMSGADFGIDSLGGQSGQFKREGERSGDKFLSGVSGSVDDGIGDEVSGGWSAGKAKIAAAAAGVGAAIGVVFASAVSQSMDIEGVEKKLGAQLGLTGPRAAEVGKVAGKLYADNFGESADQVAEAIKVAFRNGLLPADASVADIERVSGKLVTMADILEQDIPMAAEGVGNMIRNGLVKDVDEAMDVITRAIQKGGDKAGDLTQVFQEYSTEFRALGIDGAEAAGLMLQGLEGGARDADIVGDALKEMFVRSQTAMRDTAGELTDLGKAYEDLGIDGEAAQEDLAAGGDRAKDALDRVLDGLRNVQDPLKRNADAVAIFGTTAEDLQGALGNLDVTTAVEKLGDVKGATDDLGEAYDTNQAKIEAFRRKGMGKLNDYIANTLIPTVERLWPQFEAGIDQFAVWIPEWVAQFQLGWERITTFFSDGWANLVKIWDETGLDSVIIGGWNFIVAQVTATWRVYAGLWSFFCGSITGNWTAAWNGIKRVFSGVWLSITDIWGRTWRGLVEVVGGVLGALWSAITWGFDLIVNYIGGIGGRISAQASAMFNPLKESFRGVLNWIVDRWNSLGFSLSGFSLGPLGDVGAFSVGPKYGQGRLQRFHEGGTVSGTPGRERLALVMPGETFRTVGQERGLGRSFAALASMATAGLNAAATGRPGSGAGLATAGSHTGGSSITNQQIMVAPVFKGPVAKDSARWVRDTISDGVRSGVINPDRMLRRR